MTYVLPNAPSAVEEFSICMCQDLPSAVGPDSTMNASACEYWKPPEIAFWPASHGIVWSRF